MIGIIDVGGGLRGIYGAGVFDYCLDHSIHFNYCIGVSAGSANISSYISGQRGRNYQFYTEYVFRKQYMSLWNFIKHGSYIDLDYAYGILCKSDGENPLDFNALQASDIIMKVVAMNGLTGETVYFDKSDMSLNNYDICKASSCIPVVCRPYYINGVPYFDGGISDPIPLPKALADGCSKVVLILTKPLNTVRMPKKDRLPARILRHKYPKAAHRLAMRYKTYNDGVALAKQYAAQGNVLILAPDDCCGMDTLTKNHSSIQRMYEKGYQDAKQLQHFLF